MPSARAARRDPEREAAAPGPLLGIGGHAGASDPQIAAVLGYSTMKEVQTYRAQASQLLLARGAQNLRDAMYRQQLHDERVALAGNDTKPRA